MPKVIEFDLSGADEEVWERGEGEYSEAPSPGVYLFLVKEINPGFSKGSDGKPDKKRPRLEVILDVAGDKNGDPEGVATKGIEGGSCLGGRVWDYVSFSKAAEWKQAEFMKAIGEGSPKKLKGKFKAEKHEGKTHVLVRVVKEEGRSDDDYRPKVAAMWPWSGDTPSLDDADLDEELAEDDEEMEGDDELEQHSESDLKDMELSELKELAEEWEVDVAKGKKKATYIKEILAAQEEYFGDDAELEDDEEDEELEDDEDLELEDEDEELDDEEDEDEGPTAEEIREMSPQQLKELAKEHDLLPKLKGKKKSQAVEILIEELGADEDVPF